FRPENAALFGLPRKQGTRLTRKCQVVKKKGRRVASGLATGRGCPLPVLTPMGWDTEAGACGRRVIHLRTSPAWWPAASSATRASRKPPGEPLTQPTRPATSKAAEPWAASHGGFADSADSVSSARRAGRIRFRRGFPRWPPPRHANCTGLCLTE